MLLIQLDNLSVLDYEIASSNTGNVFSFAVCGVLDLSRFMGVSCFSHHVKWSSLFISLELCFVLQMRWSLDLQTRFVHSCWGRRLRLVRGALACSWCALATQYSSGSNLNVLPLVEHSEERGRLRIRKDTWNIPEGKRVRKKQS